MSLIAVTYSQMTDLTAAKKMQTLAGVVAGASNASPIVITDVAHGLVTGDIVVVEGVGGNTAANSTWTATKIDNDTFSLDGSTGNAAYTSGGTWRKIPDADIVDLQADTQDVRYRDDGTDPTASVGMLLKAGAEPTRYYGKLSALRFIEAAVGAKLNMSFYEL